jgi:uncharacterized membrane protein
MRTTLTLDDDLARGLKELAHRKRISFKRIVNETLKAGLKFGRRPGKEASSFRVEASHCGFLAGVDVGKLNQLADELEAAEHVAEESR